MKHAWWLLLALVLCGCTMKAQTATSAYMHGRTDPQVAEVVVTVTYGGSTSTSKTNSGGFWGVGVAWIPNRTYTLRVTAPEGWTVTRVGSAAGNVLQITVSDVAVLAPDIVVALRAVEAPTATPTKAPTATPTPTCTLAPKTTIPTRTIVVTVTLTPTPLSTRIPAPTPTRICEDGLLYLDYETRLNVRNTAMGLVGHVEDDADPFEDLTLIWGFREFNTAPLTPRFEYKDREGVTYLCRGFANEIIAIREGAWPCEMGVVFWDFAWPWPGFGVEYEGGRP